MTITYGLAGESYWSADPCCYCYKLVSGKVLSGIAREKDNNVGTILPVFHDFGFPIYVALYLFYHILLHIL